MKNYRNYTQELLTAQKRGAVIVCSAAPYEGMRMIYAPRRDQDPLPWAFADIGSRCGTWRYSGRFCHAEYDHWIGQQMWYLRPGALIAVLVDVVAVNRRTGFADIRHTDNPSVFPVPLFELNKSYPAR